MKDYKIIFSEGACSVEAVKSIDLENQAKISEVLDEMLSTKDGQKFLKQLEKRPKFFSHILGKVFNKEGDDYVGSLRIPYDIEEKNSIPNKVGGIDRWFTPNGGYSITGLNYNSDEISH